MSLTPTLRLPGGLVEHGVRQRGCAFQPLSGALELALAEQIERAADTPGAVTAALSLALAHLGGTPASPARVDALCVADRQFLMRELAQHLGDEQARGPRWLHSLCGHCAARFDFALEPALLPVVEAPAGFPEAEVRGDDGQLLRFRLPVGADLPELARQPDAELRRWLLHRLSLAPHALPQDPHGMDRLAERVEAALEDIAPAIVLQVQAQCPECGAACVVDLEPYGALQRRTNDLLQEVHQLAWHYHWSEAQILALPRARRQRYLQLIDRGRGLGD
ncbi:MAG TPA: hypothetical protein VLA61_24510 [Ideonella sp.]|uniref:hypothetical protein n=1 Tax=Ideonella sp. TaxID=1929293 RepID=UPI002B60B56F|nr:hypothetical protein [Ideonella sp.]HSI51443.1 hypothetical protein [Ideonella sp.]